VSLPRGLGFQLSHVDTGEPFPSPDGKKILYVTMIEDKYQIFTMNRDGTEQKQITHDGFNHDSPSWSPDGQKIAYVSDRTGHEIISMINPDGTGEERLTPENADSIHPMWSPDSKKVIYCSDDDMHPPKKNVSEVFLVDVQSKQITTLISGGTNTYPSYSPDGKRIAFRRMIGDMNSEVFVASADGTDQKNVSNHMAFDGWPAWSPDGTKIAFSSNRHANYQIWVMNADGSDPFLLANTEGRATEPRWSTDGKMIYFTNCKKVDFGADCHIMAARTV
jgi:TolB protein